MRIKVTEHPNWREPVLADVQECYDLTAERMQRRSVRWILHDNKQFEHLDRLARGLICAECLEVFPARPGADTVTTFREVYDKPAQRLPWRERVMAGCCPVCGSEVSPEYFQALHEGTLPEIPDIEMES